MPITKSFQTEEQRKAAYEAAGIIDTAVLEPTANIEFETPEETPIFDASTIEVSKIEPTKTEEKAIGMESRLEEITKTLTGEVEEFRRKKEEEFGLTREDEIAVEELNIKIKQLQRQQQAIPLEMEEEFRGRAGAIRQAGISGARKRELAIEALKTASLADAIQGRFNIAKMRVENAIEEKYGHLIREKEVIIENLDRLEKSTTATLEEKNRAKKQKAVEEAEKKQIEDEKAEREEIWDIATNAAKTIKDTTILDKIQNADTKEKALKIASEAGALIEEEKLPSDIATFKQFFPDVDVTTPEGRQQFLDWQAKTAAAKREPDIPLGMQTAADYFSPTQISAGAFNAGMDIGEFGKLSIDEANKYVRGEEETDVQKSLDLIKDTFQQYKDAGYEKDEVEQQFLAENKIDALPTPIRERLDETFPDEGEGFWSDAWSWLTGK